MKPTEAAMLCKYVQACCPQQKFDEFTPDAWFDLLGDLPFKVAKVGAREVAKRQPFVSPAEIRTSVQRIRKSVWSQVAAEDPYPSFGPDQSPLAWTEGRDNWREEVAAEADRRIAADEYNLAPVRAVGEIDEEHDTWNPPKELRRLANRLSIERAM